MNRKTERPAATTGAALDLFERHEKKYILTRQQYERLSLLLADKVHEDAYARSTISSLYYDTPDNIMINRSLENPLYKEKLRVRAYNAPGPQDPVYIELKKKYKGVVYKRRAPLSREGAKAYMAGMSYDSAARKFGCGTDEPMSARTRMNVREIDACMARYESIEPSIMIIVERLALRSNDASGLRFTFDYNARWRAHDLRFEDGFHGTYHFDDDQVIMEIKCLQAYPFWLVDILDNVKAYSTSCSKVGRAYQALHAPQTQSLAQKARAQAAVIDSAGSLVAERIACEAIPVSKGGAYA